MFVVAGFGNPLLDITVKISNNELLKKYNLNDDDQVDISDSQMKLLYNDISKYSNQVSAGGCAQNTIRVLQWLLNEPKSTVFFGGIGNDEQGNILAKLVQKDGVSTRYVIHENQSTGTCIALVKGHNRSLVANLGAAECYSVDTINQNNEIISILKSVNIIYMEAFFLINRLDVSNYIKDLSILNQTIFAFNLSGAYMVDMYPLDVVDFANACDILFGNEKEFLALGRVLKIDDLKQIAIQLNKTYSKSKTENNSLLRFGKIVVITNGSKSVLCAFNDGEVIEIDVPKLSSDKIQDTTGAGDSFVAGFLAALLKGFDLEICLKWGCWTAAQIIQQVGCSIPNYLPEVQNIFH